MLIPACTCYNILDNILKVNVSGKESSFVIYLNVVQFSNVNV